MRAKIWIATLLLGVTLGAQAQHREHDNYRYRWVDAAGLPHYSDSLSVEALKYGYDVINDQGMVVDRVKRQLTADERELAEADAARAEAAQREAARQQQSDRQLLSAYPSEAAFKQAQKARIDSLVQHMHTTEMNLHSQERNLAELLSHAADLQRQDKDVPKFLDDRIAKQREAVNVQRELLRQQQAHKQAVEKEADAHLQHYLELRAKQQALYGH